MSDQIEIKGLKELEKVLTQLPKAIQGKVLGAGVREGCKEVQKEAKVKAPVSPKAHQVGKKGRKSHIERVRPGHLKRNIKVRVKRGRNAGESIGYVYVSWKAYYGQFVERGTKHMSANPFMRPAFDTKWKVASHRIGEVLWDKTAAAARNLARGMPIGSKGILK